MNGLVVDLFAGPGGWSEGMRMLSLPDVGFEIDTAACKTRAAAGHLTVQADVSAYPTWGFGKQVHGLVASPPCTVFSAAGKRAGVAIVALLGQGIRDMFAGKDMRAERRREMARELHAARWIPLVERERARRIVAAVRSAALVLEPARFITACMPEWIVMEQVPAVLPLWQVYAEELRKLGYHTWCGKLNAADYGVPQTRPRVILIASRVRQVYRPEPTHYDPRKGMQLWGTPWVSMADALGWGMNERPYFSLCTAGGNRGGADEQVGGTGARKSLYAERDAGRWALRKDAQRNAALRPAPAPAPTISFGHAASSMQWVLRRNRGAGLLERGGPRRDHPLREPAPTISMGEAGGATRLSWVQEEEAVRISVEEAAVLQSFPADYPFQGSKTACYRQVGDAVPPLLAMHVVAMATGIKVQQSRAA